jgi:hypothetical protein
MAKGKCKRRVVRFGKWAGRFLGPMLGPFVPLAVQAVESFGSVVAGKVPDMVFGGHEKRAMALELIKAEAKRIGHAVYDDARPESEAELERIARAQVEVVVSTMKHHAEKVGDLQDGDGWADAAELAPGDD